MRRNEELDYYKQRGITTEFIQNIELFSFNASEGGHKDVAVTGDKFQISKYSDTK